MKIFCITHKPIKELNNGNIVNLGQGIPTDIIPLLKNNSNLKNIHFTLESGVSGGIPLPVPDFGISYGPDSKIRPDDMFTLFNGGGLDVSFLGFAQIDMNGNINVSKFGDSFVGCGGFIDIAQNTKKLIFCGCFNAKGLNVEIEDKKLIILNEGELKKIINSVEQVTYNPKYSSNKKQIIKIITERCVIEYINNRLVITEIMKGVDINTQILSLIDFDISVSNNLKIIEIE